MIINEFEHKTDNNKFIIKSYIDSIKTCKVEHDYELTSYYCETGCKNYRGKYSCPPFSDNFSNLEDKYGSMVVLAFVIPYIDVEKTFNMVKAANVICKTKQRHVLDKMAKNFKGYKILENGSCRLCKTCALQTKEPCRHPDKMRYSLESTGVRVDKLVKKLFNIDLNWYYKGQKDNFPQFQCVVSGILTNDPEYVKDYLSLTVNNQLKQPKPVNLFKGII